MQAMETEPPAPLQVEEELGERAAATTPSSMAAAVMLAALPQAHLLAPGAHGAAAAVVPLALGEGLLRVHQFLVGPGGGYRRLALALLHRRRLCLP